MQHLAERGVDVGFQDGSRLTLTGSAPRRQEPERHRLPLVLQDNDNGQVRIYCDGRDCFWSWPLYHAGVQAVLVVFLVTELHVPASAVGLIVASGGLGGLVGSALAAKLSRARGPAAGMHLALALTAVSGLLLATSFGTIGMYFFVIGYFLVNFGIAAFSVVSGSYRQSVCPPELLGRMVGSTRVVSWGSLPFGALVIGAVSNEGHARLGLTLSVVGLFAVCSAVALALWKMELAPVD